MVRMPTMFVTHGGGPMPLLGDPAHAPLTAFLKGAAKRLPAKPTAILVCTAHWEEAVPTVSTNPRPPMLYDYGGFPPESYAIQYPAPGPDPQLVARVRQLLESAGMPLHENAKRGYDHGTFVPLKLMFPDADIPVLQMSLMNNLNPTDHIKLGQALAPLRDEGVLVVASGSSFHNIRSMMTSIRAGHPQQQLHALAKDFDDWLTEAVTQHTGPSRQTKLEGWARAPGSKESHPREEHLIPLMVAAGAAQNEQGHVAHAFAMQGTIPVSSYSFGQAL